MPRRSRRHVWRPRPCPLQGTYWPPWSGLLRGSPGINRRASKKERNHSGTAIKRDRTGFFVERTDWPIHAVHAKAHGSASEEGEPRPKNYSRPRIVESSVNVLSEFGVNNQTLNLGSM